jgi:CheY-like chemotaxis protein
MQIFSRPNEGTKVQLWLPVAPEPPSTGISFAASDSTLRPGRRVMLVDDDPLVLTTTADMLRELGHDPVPIASASRALEFLRTAGPPDLAILDYAMPEMTGAVLAERMRKEFPDLPLILATGYSDGSRPVADLPRLEKPYSTAQLAQQIDLVAARREVSAVPQPSPVG